MAHSDPFRLAAHRALGTSLAVLIVAGCGAGTAEGGGAADLRAPGANLLLFTVDTLRADRVGAYGDAAAATPALDGLARRGALFANCYSSVPLTLPSHATLFTGRYPPRHGVRTNGRFRLPAAESTLAEALSGAGYDTAAVIASYALASRFALDQGFARYDDALGATLLRGFDSEIPAAEATERFLAWLGGAREPFFGWLHFYDPHLPYTPPEPYASRFADDPYRGEVAYADAQLGRVLAAVDAAGRRERTLVVVTSDHGEAFGEHGEIGHGVLTYEEALRVPLVVALGDRWAGRRVESRVRLVDLAPTLLDLLGVPLPAATLDGESFTPLLGGAPGGAARREPEVYFESLLGYEENHWAPITGLLGGGADRQYKYVALPDRELFDLDLDPAEKKNAFADQRRVGARLDARLRELLAATAGDARGDAARREVDAEDLAHLQALGYVSASGGRSRDLLDPRQGVLIEREIADVQALLDGGDTDGAAGALRDLVARHPGVTVSTLFALRHAVHAASGEDAAAVAAIEEAMVAFPESERFPTLLGEHYLRKGDLAAAETQALRALELDPRASRAAILRGRIADRRGDAVAAVAHYRLAFELEPRNAPLELLLADALVRGGDLDGAAGHYAALAAAGRLDGEARVRAALVADRRGRGGEAEALLEGALADDPRGVHRLTYALMLGRHGRVADARRELEGLLRERGDELAPAERQLAETALRGWSGGD